MIARMTFKEMVYFGLVVSALCVVVAVLAILLDKGSYMRSYSRWRKGK